MKNLVVRAITGVIFVAAIVSCFLRPLAMVFLFALITTLTIWEYCGLVNERADVHVNRFISTAAGFFLFLAMAGYCSGIAPSAVFIPYLITLVYLFVSELYAKAPDPINNWAYTMLSQLYVALPFSLVNVLAFTADGAGQVCYNYLLPLMVFVFLWTSDTGAYCAGSLFGRHKLFPRVSPGKSWEGSVGGALLCVCVALAVAFCGPSTAVGECAATVGGLFPVQWVGLGLVVCVFGTWGDLVESLFKRTLGIKDSGNILPGHGGMLDRFDSSLMAIPAAVVYLYTLSLLQ